MLCLVFGCLVLAAAPLAARPIPNAGARALALGGAYTAEDEDVNVLFYNPAGLTGLNGKQISANYGRLNPGALSAISEIHGAFGMPTNFQGRPIGAAGGFLSQAVAPGVHRFDLYSGFGTDVPTQGLVPWPVHGGGVLKIREQGGGDKDANIGKTKFGFGLDAGAQLKFNEDATVGVALRDLFTSGLNPPGPQLRLGGKYRYQQKLVLLGDVELRKVTSFHAGAEWLFYRDLLKLRIGNGFRVARGDANIDHLALGAGFNYSPCQVDIAYLIPLKTLNDVSEQWRVSVLYKFNAPRFSELYYDRALDMADDVDRRVSQLEEKEAQLKTAVQDLEQARRLAEEDMARTSVKRTESERELQDELVKAQARANQAEQRAKDLEEKVQSAEEKIRRAERISRPAAPAPAGPTIRKHVVQPGDSLRSLAKKYYNDPERWQTIYNANKDKVDRGRLVPGSELVIPE